MATKKTKKAPAKKPAAKAAAKPRIEAKPAPTKITASTSVRTKGEVFNTIAGATGLTRKDVSSVFDAFGSICQADLGKKGPGIVNLAGMAKVVVTRKPATKERVGINPFTGEQQTFKAKPARNVVKIRPMKALKDIVA